LVAKGARTLFIERPYAYGLGSAGKAGVAQAIETLRTD